MQFTQLVQLSKMTIPCPYLDFLFSCQSSLCLFPHSTQQCSGKKKKIKYTSCCYATSELPEGHKWAGCWSIHVFFLSSHSVEGRAVWLACLWRRTAAMWAQGVCLHAMCCPLTTVCRMASRHRLRCGRSDSPWFDLTLSLSLSPWSVHFLLLQWPE